jgi:hypothetical protein
VLGGADVEDGGVVDVVVALVIADGLEVDSAR